MGLKLPINFIGKKFEIKFYVTSCIAAMKLWLCHSLVRSAQHSTFNI